jgi:hypothetical protein
VGALYTGQGITNWSGATRAPTGPMWAAAMRWAARITGISRRRCRRAVRTDTPTCPALPHRGRGGFVPVRMDEQAGPSLCSCGCSRVSLPTDYRLTRQRDIGRSSRARSLASTFELPPLQAATAKDVPLVGRSDTGFLRSYRRIESSDGQGLPSSADREPRVGASGSRLWWSSPLIGRVRRFGGLRC